MCIMYVATSDSPKIQFGRSFWQTSGEEISYKKIFETLNLFEALVTAIFRYYLFFQNKVFPNNGYFNMILRLLISIFNL